MMLEKKRIYILVKTYPTISEQYSELVCTAGVLEDGSWIRLYPMPFRLLNDDQKYPKYTWVEVNAERNTSDFRPESYRPDISTMVVEPKPKKVNWDERRRVIFNNKQIHTNLQRLIDEAKSPSRTSLAVFKPTKILDFVIESDDRDWDPKKLASLQSQSQQLNLFKTIEEIEEEFKVVQKVPYKFSYRFEDDSGKQSKMMVEDWEVGMLYRHCLYRAGNNEAAATAKVKNKYLDTFLKHDTYFFLGTTKQFHNVAPNPFIIVGVFYPPMPSPNQQMSLFDFIDGI
ncbi:hypothetical protein [Desulfitobacterium chlororespirans]|uniref:Uncharacterized protein n=1 Tax=Desulfitobacterium chlororespirans DSM 11544 TaxID=1121395 RepID=A0A1M7RWS2_9FIRM|nr:hypothetical protein [Desulfitobacterium chlororespirans]SHN50564.1 hypothetical protein SAMN02745215_00199 [Desulfitobacterium chlororespirans DSM 11544]